MASDDGRHGLEEESDEWADATMELSLQDVFALRKEDRRGEAAPPASEVSEVSEVSEAPTPSPAARNATLPMETASTSQRPQRDDPHKKATRPLRPISAPQIEAPLDDVATQELDPLVLDDVPERASDHTGVLSSLEASMRSAPRFDESIPPQGRDMFGAPVDAANLEEDTNPSLDAIPTSLADEPTDPTNEFENPLAGPDGPMTLEEAVSTDSTSVMRPDAALLEAARRGWEAAKEQESQSSLASTSNAWATDDEGEEDGATGLFEIPASLLSQLKAEAAAEAEQEQPRREPQPMSAAQSRALDQLTREKDRDLVAELSHPDIGALRLEAVAEVDEEGRLVLPAEMVRFGALRPGMRVRLKIEIIE